MNPEDGADPDDTDANGVKGSGIPSVVDAGVWVYDCCDVVRLPAVLGRDASMMLGIDLAPRITLRPKVDQEEGGAGDWEEAGGGVCTEEL